MKEFEDLLKIKMLKSRLVKVKAKKDLSYKSIYDKMMSEAINKRVNIISKESEWIKQ